MRSSRLNSLEFHKANSVGCRQDSCLALWVHPFNRFASVANRSHKMAHKLLKKQRGDNNKRQGLRRLTGTTSALQPPQWQSLTECHLPIASSQLFLAGQKSCQENHAFKENAEQKPEKVVMTIFLTPETSEGDMLPGAWKVLNYPQLEPGGPWFKPQLLLASRMSNC